MAKKNTYTPMMQHYLEIKQQHQDAIIFYRLGDFYEMFFEDCLLYTSSVVNATIAYILMDIGIIGKTFAMLSWQMPSIFGAFLSTMDIKAFLLIIVLIIIDILIYYPFFKIYEKQLVQQEISEEE